MTAATIDRLFVIWASPTTRRRHVIGHLLRDRSAGGFRFWYEKDLSAAEAQGFYLLPAFPSHHSEDIPYCARHLWTTFADRIPSPQRRDTRDILVAWGVEREDDQFEILARSGGLRATDRLELAEYRASDDDLGVPLEFRVAGARHVPSAARATLAQGEELALRREPSNEFDTAATVVEARTGRSIGYVPRQYSYLIARLLDAAVPLRALAVRELAIPDDAGRWVVRAERVR